MTPSTPRFPPDNLPLEPTPVTPEGVTWWALVGPYDPPLAVGRTPAEAELRLHAQLLHFHRVEADPLPSDPIAFAARDLARWKSGALLAGFARDEVAAFLAWRLSSSLALEEALLRWRDVFPAPEGPDPLQALRLGQALDRSKSRKRRPR